MIKFILKLFRFVFFFNLFVLVYILVLLCINVILNSSFSDNNTIFIWGDSQAYRGIDLKELSNITKKKVYSSAHPGSGVYDFLLFTEQVQEKSKVIVSISKLVQVRKKSNDYNRTGLSFWALKKLHDNNYSVKEIASIIKRNLSPKKNIFDDNSLHLFAYSDSMKINLHIPRFRSYYKKTPLFLEDKQKLYITGIENLIRKNCEILLLEFPYHKKLESIESESTIKNKTEEFKQKLSKLFNNIKVDSIKLRNDINLFKDLSHLNSSGAKDLTKKLGTKIQANNYKTTFYIAD